ncbi:hypothetical protein Tco_0530538 [Tanacetum coccineum]
MSTKEHEKRHRSRCSHSPRPSPSVFSRIRRNRSRSPRQNSRDKEGGVFKRLGNRGKSVSVCSDSHNLRSYSRYIESLLESEDNGGGHWKSRSKKKKLNREEDDLSQPWVSEGSLKDLLGSYKDRAVDHANLVSHVQLYVNGKREGKFKALPPMTTPVEKRNQAKFCEFHGEVGHNTEECMHLKKQIEEMLKAGKLSHLIKELKQNNRKEYPKATKKGEIF